MIIEYWSDYSCPYCYIAETRLKNAMHNLGIEDECRLDFKAFRLNPNAKVIPQHRMVESLAHGYGISVRTAEAEIKKIEYIGRAEGLDFKYGTSWNANTLDALRLTKFAQSKGRAVGDRMIERLYKAFFSDNVILGDRDVLVSLAEEVGLDGGEVRTMLGSDDFTKEVEEDEAVAHSYGVRAVPFFVFNNKYAVPGAIETKDFETLLKKVLAEEDDTSADMKGQVCGPDGCH